jgi:ABC-type glycerol-3-phosphate transport system permease component
MLTIVLIILTIPYAVYLIPVFILENHLNLVNTKLGLILPYVALNLPLAIFIMRGTFRNVPAELEDAALIDGANHFQIWYQIMIPLAMPGVATTGIFTFVMVWSEFMFARALMLSRDSFTLPIGITFLQNEAQSWNFGVLAAAIVLTLIPVMIVFVALQRYLVKGIMEGALKG